jgi:hypothetical protein
MSAAVIGEHLGEPLAIVAAREHLGEHGAQSTAAVLGERFRFRAVPTAGNQRKAARHAHERRSVPRFPDTARPGNGRPRPR